MQERGSGFFSFSGTFYRPDGLWEYETSVYGQWGATNWLTVGIDFHEKSDISGHGLIFARLPLMTGWRNNYLALELAVGRHHIHENIHPMYKTTVSYGRAIEVADLPGWIAIDAALERRTDFDQEFYKLDLTAGLSADSAVNPMLKIETTYDGTNDLIWSATPSLILRNKTGGRWVIGVERRSAYPEGIGLEIGLWRNF
ncbi:MAG: hypothetical protein AAF408_00430 [Pseudomonadota bacterium]